MKLKTKLIASGIGLLILAAVVISSFTIIPTGYTGVRTTFGQVEEKTLSPGFNWQIPFVQSIELVNNKQQDIEYEGQIWSETSERTAIYYDGVSVTYQINPERSAWIYAHVSDYENYLVTQNLVASAIKTASKSLSDVDATNRGLIEPLVLDTLQKSLDDKYEKDTIIINKITISNVDFDESYNKAIADKQKAMIEAQQQAIENEKAIAKAEAEATVKKTQAQAEAEAELIRAQAEAEANELLQQSLSEEILKDKYIEKWNGEMPKYVGGDGAGVLIDLEDKTNTTNTTTDDTQE